MPKLGTTKNPEINKDIKKLRAEGKTLKEVAEKLNVSESIVNYHLYGKGTKKKHALNGNSKKAVSNTNSKKNTNHAPVVPPGIETQQAYATGRVEEILRGYAASSGVSFATFTLGVADSLHACARRELLRMQDRMQTLRGKATV